MQDLRFAARFLARQPGFAAVAILTLALGIGATAAVFSIVDGVLLTSPPYRDPARLVLIPSVRTDSQRVEHLQGTPAAEWLDWQKQASTFDGIAAYVWTFNFFVDADGSDSAEGMIVTREYFDVLGIKPILGRAFTAEDVKTAAAPVIILGYDLWHRKFSGDPQVIGKTVRMSRRDTPLTIVGVMPAGVRFLPSPSASQEPSYDVNAAVDFWLPGVPNPQRLKQSTWDLVGRLAPASTPAAAQADLAVRAAQAAGAEPDFSAISPRVQPLEAEMNHDARRVLLPLFGAAALVLLIACGNTAALLLVRGLQRQQEYAVRSALGSGRAATFRLVAVESLLLAILGGAAGIGVAVAIVRVLKAIGGHAIPRLDAVTVGWPLLAWGVASAIVAALAAGVVPAWRASRLDPIAALKDAGPRSSAGRGERRLLRSVTMMQTALTLALLVSAGLLIRTMQKVAGVQAGYSTERILTMTVTAVQGDWSEFHHRALERVERVPGVQAAAFAWGVPLTGNDWPGLVEIEGHPVNTVKDRVALPIRSVTPGYFALMGIGLAQGRDFRDTDGPKTTPVAIVNQVLVDRYFQGVNAIGKKIWGGGRDRPAVEIVGVAGASRTDDLTRPPEPEIYLCLWQSNAFSKDLVVRTAGDPRSVLSAVRRELRDVDPTVAVEHIRTLNEIRTDSLASRIFARQLLIGFSLAGTILTVVGVYGVLALSVAARRREIAIRAAVGADRAHIRNLVLGEGMRLVGAGVAAGVLIAVLLARVLAAFLFEVEPTDPATLIGAGSMFVLVTLCACWVPIVRAARVDPIEALRSE